MLDVEQDIYLTPSDVLEYLFCPRFIFYERVMLIPEHQELRFKVRKGREVHERKAIQNPVYLRRKLGVVEKKVDVWMASPGLRVRGRVDEVLFLDDGTAAPLDYKFAEWKSKIFLNHRVQSAIYGLLIQENFDKVVNRGYLVYVRSKNHLEEIRFGERDFNRAAQVLGEVLEIIQRGTFPKRTKWRVRCVDCCYKNICV